MKKGKRIMKNMKRILALLIAVLMIATMVPAFAAETYDGKITIHSPIMGAKYFGYRVFDMAMNASGDAYTYTIKDNSPFFTKVKAYAEDKGDPAGEEPIKGLTLTQTNSDEHTYFVTADGKFDAQDFGKYLELQLKGDPTANPPVAATITGATAYTPTYEDEANCVTVAKSEAVSFENLPLGYYLILSEYVAPTATVTVKDAAGNEYGTITKDSTDAEKNAIIAAYVAAQTTDEKIQAYIDANNLKDSDADGNEIAIEKDSDAWKDVKNQLVESTTADAQLKIAQALNQIAGSEADDNAVTQRMVFIDTTKPTADIIEKNEEHKWDVPVNPEGGADLKPHGEPSGGKNIVIKEQEGNNPAVYADWTEANIGDSVHYQLSVNAVNFERASNGKVKQIKEYVIADFENKNMTYDTTKGLTVRIVKKQADGTVVEVSQPMDYSDWANKFFHNDNKGDLGKTGSEYDSLFGGTEGGLVIPWVEELQTKPDDMTNVTVTEEPTQTPAYYKVSSAADLTPNEVAAGWTVDANGFVLNEKGEQIRLVDANGNPAFETEPHYFKSLYPNDVTILVDYWMILNDTATVDGDGNINISQYGVNFIEENTYSYTPPTANDNVKPSEEKEHDDAKVYTYALAIHKVDDKGYDLAGAEFAIKGLTVTKVKDGWYKVKSFNNASDAAFGDTMTTDAKGFLVVEGLMTSQEVEIKEIKAPDGYNKLEGTVKTNPQKIAAEVKTSSTVIYYADEAKTTPTGKVVTETVEQYKDGTVLKSVKTTTYNWNGTDFDVADESTTITGTPAPSEIDQTQLKPYEFKVVNKQGTELPSTGGMGTTLFYIGGGILVVLAIVMLVTKRRMSSND